MIYPIVVYGDPVLKKRAKEIAKGTDVKAMAEDMFETMYNANGVGLAAPQIGKSIRLFIIDGKDTDNEEMKDFKRIFVNPELLDESGDPWAFEEGCLSIPQIREDVNRKNTIRLRYFDEDWNEHEEEFNGLKARVIQHEYDHIEGILFTDYLSPFKRKILKGKLNDISKGKVDVDYKIKAPLSK